ncbi:hypothetical protein AX14_004482 [Amanita brunnescens Koide BX004]|nr:hypothetical protein AX14_004482 [Amanita brunnescens Koide BX004]
MAPTPSGPPGPPRPKKSSSSPSNKPPLIFSPAPSQPRTSWFQLLGSPSSSPIPFLPPAVATHNEFSAQPDAVISQITSATAVQPVGQLPSNLIGNKALISNISMDANPKRK